MIELKGKYNMMDTEAITKLTKTSVVIPKDIFRALHLLDAKLIIAKLFLGQDAWFATRLSSGIQALRHSFHMIEQRSTSDPDLIAKIIIAIDDRTNKFFDECAGANRALTKSSF